MKSRITTPAAFAFAALTATALLAGCSGATPAPTPTAAASSTQSPAPGPSESSTTEPAPSPTPDAVGEFSQEVDGVVYEGTEIAPSRVGNDTPGQPPAAEPQITRENYEQLAVSENKYVVYVFGDIDDGGYLWKVFGQSRHGSFRQLSWSLDAGEAGRYGSSAEAQGAPIVVDGRTLDRSEYILFVEP